ncbi:MAG: response regulator transcription factor [Acutalibacteraceae bacterium]|nr:response regulator transcription factor [Acutalibacteraceae bacterium]
MARVLVADDESKLRRLVCDFLRRAGHETIETSTGKEALDIFNSDPRIELCLLDIMIPEIDGWELCRQIRKASSVPIILLTARSAEFDEITGFDAGADDYVTKPFSPTVLMKRIDALLRRVNSRVTKNDKDIISLDGLVMNNEAHQVTIDDEQIDLTLKEYNILQKLISSRGRVYTREQLLDDIWGYDYVGDARNVDSHVARLRSKLGSWGVAHLKTIYGVGYKIEVN